ncbi:uroporphyrinogen decarboxylase family protein [Candidatus Omnitrophota bacterium]
MTFIPDYTHLLDVMDNKRPPRLPLYEHIISPAVMERILGTRFAALENGSPSEQAEFFAHYCRFFRDMTYDTVSYEVCITEVLPDHGAIMGGRPGPIQNRNDFERYPWCEIPDLFWIHAKSRFDNLCRSLPTGMKAVGGVGNGVFEIAEDLVGFEYLCYLQVDDPKLFEDLFIRIGSLMGRIWKRFLEQYAGYFAVCRFGDDLGFKTGLLISPETIRNSVIPRYRHFIDLVHSFGKPFLWHSCGCIFDVMDDVIAAGIDAKHSNEDIIAPFDVWISRYSDRIALLGGIDVDLLCRETPDDIVRQVVESGTRFRNNANGYALGSGNSIPDYVPAEGYLAMIEAVRKIREMESVL